MEIAIREMRKSRDDPEHIDKEDPLVGAVLLTPTGKVYRAHRARLREGDHAEETLLERDLHAKDVEGSTLYVTLEPCSSRPTRTPCAKLISQARIGRVFVGIPDPNPNIEGHGVAYLRKRRIEVHFFDDDLAREIEKENKDFIEFWTQQRVSPPRLPEELESSSRQETKPVPGTRVNVFSLNIVRRYATACKLPYKVPSARLWDHFKVRGLLADQKGRDLVTIAGLVLFGDKPDTFLPRCKVKVDSFTGTFKEGSLAETVAGGGLRDITGPLMQIVDNVEDFFREHVEKVPRFEGSRRVTDTEYPWLAVREAVVNALVHRDYSKPAHVFFQIFRDRIVVKSPGLMIRPNTPEKIKTSAVVSVRRNERIAAAMFDLGYMEERGTGFERISRYLRMYGLRDADYKEEGGFFTVAFYGRALAPISRRLTPEIRAKLTERQLLLMALLEKRGGITSKQYRDEIKNRREYDITRETANQDFQKLLELGLIDRKGIGRSTYYVLSGI